jgi:hypothetical protein
MNRLSSHRLLSSGLVIGLFLSVLGCAKPPTQEITGAENAINTAVQSGAADYAAVELKAAQDALSDANAKVETKDFAAAKVAALDAKAKADAAAAAVEMNRAAAKTASEEALAGAKKAYEEAAADVAKLKGAAAAKAKELAGAVDATLKSAQADWEGGSYMKVSQTVEGLNESIASLKTAVDEALAAAKKSTKKKR